jgi:hypothetical protein
MALLSVFICGGFALVVLEADRSPRATGTRTISPTKSVGGTDSGNCGTAGRIPDSGTYYFCSWTADASSAIVAEVILHGCKFTGVKGTGSVGAHAVSVCL